MGPPSSGADRVERTVVASVDHAVRGRRRRTRRASGSRVQAPRRGASPTMHCASRRASRTSCASRAAQLCVWGGESTIVLPADAGRGGRNQHLALATARLIAGHAELLLLAAGTDGSDGVSADAGALVDADTCARITLAQLDADECLRQADSARALAASGDLVHTGPTGTNVGDLVIGLKLSLAQARVLAERHGGVRPRVL